MKDTTEPKLAEPLIDLKAFILSIWSNVYIPLLLFFLSIPVSIYIIGSSTPMYQARTVISQQVSSAGQSSSSPYGINNSLISLLNPSGPIPQSDFLPKLLGSDFLKLVYRSKKDIEASLDKYCSFRPPGSLSLTYFFDKIGVMMGQKSDPMLNRNVGFSRVR